MTIGRMVVGTDGSDSAWRAVAHAVRLACRTGAEVLVAHAFASPGGGREVEAEPGRDVGASVLRDVTAEFGGRASLRCLLREGDPTEQLIDLAREEDADLIVVGNRGMGRRALLGAVPSKVAHRAPCSVLIAHTAGGDHGEPYRRIVIGTDGSPTATRAVGEGLDLARMVGAEVLVVHAGDPARGAEVLERTLRDVTVDEPPETRTASGEPAGALIEVAREEDADLIVVGNRGMTGARRFLTSVPSRVAHHAPCHVLLVKTT
ncbi:MAG: universal stress protein [Actinomycetota bacterium]